MSDQRKKLSPEQVDSLRLDRVRGAKLRELAQKYRVSFQTVSKIVNGRSWKTQPALTCPFCKKAIR